MRVPCGYPGSSQNGRPNRVQEYYTEGQAVTYSCDQGYFLMGPASRKCTDNGTWTPARIPLCDSRLGGLEESGSAESSQPLHEYPARLAIDGDAATCAYAGRSPPRWWRLDLGRSYRILSIALTVADPQSEQNLIVFILGLNGNSAIYQRCATFSGKFASSSVVLPCGGGGTNEGGLVGRYLHIEDQRKDLSYFGVCEVDVLVLRERYECGQPERPVNSYTVRLKPDQVEYRCVAGHRLVGNRRRLCLTNGQWSGSQPLCVKVLCPAPEPIVNGSVRLRSAGVSSDGQQAVLDSVAVYTCNPGFILKSAPESGTNGSRLCNEDGEWKPSQPPVCEPLDCGRPFVPAFFPEGTTLKLLNGTQTGHGAMARLRCPDGYEPSSGHDDLVHCRGDGTWNKPKIKCLSGLHVASSPVEAAREEPGEAVTLGLVLGLVGTILLLTMVLAILCIILRRSRSASSPVEAPQEGDGICKTETTVATETETSGKTDQATETDCDGCEAKTERQLAAESHWRKGIWGVLGDGTERTRNEDVETERTRDADCGTERTSDEEYEAERTRNEDDGTERTTDDDYGTERTTDEDYGAERTRGADDGTEENGSSSEENIWKRYEEKKARADMKLGYHPEPETETENRTDTTETDRRTDETESERQTDGTETDWQYKPPRRSRYGTRLVNDADKTETEGEETERDAENVDGIWDGTETENATEEKDDTKAEKETEGTETEMESVSELESESETELENENELETESETESEGEGQAQTSP